MRSHIRRGRPTTVTAIAAVTVAAASLLPIGYLFLSGMSIGDVRRQLAYAATTDALGQTLALTVLVCVLTAVLGAGAAVLVTRTNAPAPRLLTVLFSLPLAVPGFVSAYAIYSVELVYAPRLGVVTSLPGAVVVLALSLYPYVFLPCVIALRGVDPALEEVVATLRRNRLSAFRTVSLPALRPALAAGLLIVALHVLAEYGAVVQLGRSTLTTKIMAEMLDYGDYQSARSLSLVLAGLSMIVLLSTRWISGRSVIGAVARGGARPPSRTSLGAARGPVTLLALLVPLLAVGPTVLMTVRGLLSSHRASAPTWTHVWSALSTTVGYAVAAALIATVCALPVSWWVTRRPSVTSQLTERAVWLAHAIPSAILALALVFLATRLVPSLYKTPAVLIAAYVILFLPLAVANQRVGLHSARQSYDDVAASLGSRPVRTFARVTLPLASPGFIAGAILVALDASKELTTTLMLLPFNANTLSSELWATTNGESLDFTAAAPYAALLVLLGIVPVYLLVRHTLAQLSPARPVGIGPASGPPVPRDVAGASPDEVVLALAANE
ncbi:MAG: iron ABC transporter permease [Humibacillus sp.]|nr:iron ABC transporter permease [Humibacillus sp.]